MAVGFAVVVPLTATGAPVVVVVPLKAGFEEGWTLSVILGNE